MAQISINYVKQRSSAVDLFFSLADSVANISQSITSGDRLLEIHNHELVSHPERDCLQVVQVSKY